MSTKFQITSVCLQRQKKRLVVELGMHIHCRDLNEDSMRMVTPVLSDESHHLELPLVLVAGKRRYRAMRFAIWGFSKNLLRPYKIRKFFNAFGRRSISYLYRVELDYEDWMQHAGVQLV